MYIILIVGVVLCLITIVVVMFNGNNILTDLNHSYLEKKNELLKIMDRIVIELSQDENTNITDVYEKLELNEKVNLIYSLVCEKNDSKNKLKLLECVKIYNNFIDFYKAEIENNNSVLREEKIMSLEKIIINKQANQ